MPYVLVTPPPAEPVTVMEAKEHLKIDEPADDTTMRTLIAVARQYLDGPDGVLGRVLVTSTYDLVLDQFPCGRDPLWLFPPLQDVVAITYLDPQGVEQAWESYAVDLANGRIVPAYGEGYPPTRAMPAAVTVRFTAGRPLGQLAAADKQMVLALVAHYYAHRGDEALPLPLPVAELIESRRRLTLA